MSSQKSDPLINEGQAFRPLFMVHCKRERVFEYVVCAIHTWYLVFEYTTRECNDFGYIMFWDATVAAVAAPRSTSALSRSTSNKHKNGEFGHICVKLTYRRKWAFQFPYYAYSTSLRLKNRCTPAYTVVKNLLMNKLKDNS